VKAAVLALPTDADFEPAPELLALAFALQRKGGVGWFFSRRVDHAAADSNQRLKTD